MDEYIAGIVAGTLLPRLVALTASKEQALLQLKGAAGEHQGSWRTVLYVLNERIRMEERRIASKMALLKFGYKKGARK